MRLSELLLEWQQIQFEEREDIMRKSTTLIEGVSFRLALPCFTCYYMKIDDPSGRTKPGF